MRRTNPAKEADKESPGRWGTRRREDEGPSRGGEAVTQEDIVSGDDAPSERATREPKSTRRDREAARRGPGAEFGVSEGQSQVPVGDRRVSEWRGRARTWAGACSPQPNARSGRRLRVYLCDRRCSDRRVPSTVARTARFAQDYPGVTTGCRTSRGPLRARHARSRPCWGDHIGERGVAPSDGSRHPGRRAERGRCASAGQTDRCRSRLPVRHPGNSTRPLGRRSGGRGRQPALAGGQSPAPRQPRFARSARPAAARRRARTVVGHRCCHLAATLSENK